MSIIPLFFNYVNDPVVFRKNFETLNAVTLSSYKFIHS